MSGLENKDRWVCPNDRELTLRAKLDSGWSVKSGTSYPVPDQTITDAEQKVIMDVIKRAQQAEMIEKNRIGRLIDRLNNMKRNAKGDGNRYCALCNDEFGLFGAHCHHCKDCNKAVCSKCGVDTFTSEKEPIWLCKICSETREMWKKSGAWFFNSMPKFPLSSVSFDISKSNEEPQSPRNSVNNESLQSGYNKTSRISSPLASPVIRRKSRSPSPRKYRFGVSNANNQSPSRTSTSEFGAAIDAANAGSATDETNGKDNFGKRFAQIK